MRMATIARLALGKSKVLLSLWNQFNKPIMYNNQIINNNPSYDQSTAHCWMYNQHLLVPLNLDYYICAHVKMQSKCNASI